MASDIEIPQAGQSILGRVIRPDEDDLSADAARPLLRLHFEEKDLKRMLDLAERNKLGQLNDAELAELKDFRQAVRTRGPALRVSDRDGCSSYG